MDKMMNKWMDEIIGWMDKMNQSTNQWMDRGRMNELTEFEVVALDG